MQINTSLLKQERTKRAWSQEHLAQVAGLGLRTVQRIEASGTASNESIASIATVLDMRVADFVKGHGKKADPYAVVRLLALALPDVKDRSGKLGVAFGFKGKLLACTAIDRSAEDNSLMVTIGARRRKELLAQDPLVYYLTAHYAPYPAILVRLARIKRAALKELLNESLAFMRKTAT
jgi:DNA-binding XRE family transcriptional regulator